MKRRGRAGTALGALTRWDWMRIAFMLVILVVLVISIIGLFGMGRISK